MKLGVIMDPITGIKIHKDSTFAMLLAAQKRNWDILYMELPDLYLRDDRPYARMRELTVRDNKHDWFSYTGEQTLPLDQLDIILMRKDPPFNMEYIYTTHLLDHAERAGVLVVNRPGSLRDANEKLFISHFPACAPPTLVTRNAGLIKSFIEEHQEIILKPLDGMGGQSIFRTHTTDHNTNVIIESLTNHGSRFAVAQKYLPEIIHGDKRILMIDGEPVDYALARIPMAGEHRGNLAAGGTGKGVELSTRDRWICDQVGPVLREKGLLFVGLDVIGDYLTEINVTSPTCIRELEAIYSIDIAGRLMDTLARKLPQGKV
ncbi:MAG: glutathione synthase [Gammaproteobacteria bacterium RIFCSPLOWO2_02_FULL_52_10]|nr:MAG: glutathione synthase [Gammaproteobacteria bacterium RIFCSPLOWO2_02_FULL_52_10]